MGGKNWILYVTDESEQERVVPLSNTRPLTIGRASSSGLRLKAPGISRNHALLDWQLDRPFLTDLGSTNGTRVGKYVVSAPRELRSGETIHLAGAKLRIVAVEVSDPYPATSPLESLPRADNRSVRRDSQETTLIHPSDRAARSVTPWRQRSTRLILGAGALAAAVLGVVNLWDRFFPEDLADVAEIESVHLISQMKLADFASGGLKQDLSLRPAARPADGSAYETRWLTWVRDKNLLPASQMPTPTSYAPASTPAATHSTPPSGTAATSSISPTAGTPDSEPPSSPPSPDVTSSTPSNTSGPATQENTERMIDFNSVRPNEEHYDHVKEVCGQESLEDLKPPACEGFSHHNSETVDDKGDLRPPPEVAAVLARAMSDVEMVESEQGKDPVGWILAVRLDLEGLANVPMLLTWSLAGDDIPEVWRAENFAYRVTARTQHDAGIADIWFPDLVRPGAYNVNVKLSFASDGLIADRQHFEVDSG